MEHEAVYCSCYGLGTDRVLNRYGGVISKLFLPPTVIGKVSLLALHVDEILKRQVAVEARGRGAPE
jgi:hypothetical protein